MAGSFALKLSFLIPLFVTFLAFADGQISVTHVFSDQISSGTQLVILGDSNHLNQDIRNQAAALIGSLRKNSSDVNCLFLEWGRDSNSIFEDYLRTLPLAQLRFAD